MPSEVTFDEILRIVEIIHTGVLKSVNLQSATDDGIAVLMDTGADNVLIDTSNLVSVENLFDLYELPAQYSDADLSREIKIALVSPKTSEARAAAQFYDNVCNNRGWLVRPFEDHGAAIEWLTSKDSS
jgi:hypothetical protein